MIGEKVTFFAAHKAVSYLYKFFLELVQQLKAESDKNIRKVVESLEETEEFIKRVHGLDLDLRVFVKHLNFLDQEKYALLRKQILDRGNGLLRDLEKEKL